MTENNLYPLSLPQEAFYYDYLLNQNDNKYNMCGALILDGDLDIELYRKAFNYVITKYDAMRIKFIKEGEILYQQFLPEIICDIKYFDFRAGKNPAEEAITFLFEIFREPLPIKSDNLFSEMILRLENKKYIIVPKFHHMIYDAYGRSIINQALSDSYNSLLEKQSLPDLKSFSYTDFIDDDIKYRNSEEYKKSFEYWKNKLAVLPEPFIFTSKKQGFKNISLHTDRMTLNLHRICFESILNIAYEQDGTTFQVILGLIAVLLNRCYKQNQMIIGMPVLNRSNFKFRNTPGLFMNMMPLKLDLNPEGTFEDVINSIKSEVREAYRHQRFPLKDTIKYLRSCRQLKSELFDVTVIYRKIDFSQRFGDAKLNTVTLDTETRNESLSIEIDEYDEKGSINIFFNYNPVVISDDEMIQFIHCFETILIDLIHFPEKKLKEISILNSYETDKILNEFNSPTIKNTTNKTIVEVFEETAARKGDAAAVICNENIISYKELNEKANSIAHFLLTNYNIQPEEIICLALDRSINAIAVILGILKTGAAYLPIDIDYPVERIKYIVENSNSRILITNGVAGNKLSEIEITLSDIKSNNKDNIGIRIKPENLAYVIYTSGSTGKPKGVLIEHGQFMTMFVNVIEDYGVKETDHVLQFASLGFDASVFEIFQALLTGAVLVITDKEKIHNTGLFTSYLEEKNVTFATLPPAYLSALDKN
jgi:non-ribosomal peptide synthetase component F